MNLTRGTQEFPNHIKAIFKSDESDIDGSDLDFVCTLECMSTVWINNNSNKRAPLKMHMMSVAMCGIEGEGYQ